MTKTILICSNVYPPNFIGGAELIAHQQAKILKQLGENVFVFAGDHASGGVRYSMRQDCYDGLPVFRVSLFPSDYQSDFVNFFHPLVEEHFNALLDAVCPDVVHMHNIIGLSVGIIGAAKRRGIKTVVTLHDHWGFCHKNTLIKRGNEICTDYTRCAECMPLIGDGDEKNFPINMRRDFMKYQLSQVDVFISPSRYLAETYVRAGIPVGKMKLIWNGIDIERFSRVVKTQRSGKVRFTFLGHLGAHKGINVLIDALSLVPFQERLFVNLVGTGEMEASLRKRVETLGLSSVVNFWGRVNSDQVEKVYERTDVLILPSIWPENQPGTITEAMATRTPVIASAIGGIPELVIDGRNGYLFQPGSAQELAARMSALITCPERIKLMGENGFLKIKDSPFEHQVERIRSVYE